MTESSQSASAPIEPAAASAVDGFSGAVPHLRVRGDGEQRTTALELFFDLIYVFAVTQLSHLVIDGHVSLESVGRASFLLIVVWWAWIYTTWMVNWFDPESTPVRMLLTAIALASLLMSASIPKAFGSDGIWFAVAYIALQNGRNSIAMLLLQRSHSLRRVFERIVASSTVSALLWLAGGIWAHDRLGLWCGALAIDLIAPLLGYRTPGLGRSLTSDWPVDGGHFAERFQSFIIIALGESIVVTGATASTRGLSDGVVGSLALAFLVTAELWWLYFGEVAEHARHDIATSDDPGRLARDAYTYLHLPIAAGIIMIAVADDLLISAPGHHLSGGAIVMAALGPAVYLFGESLVRIRMTGRYSLKRLGTVAALVVLSLIGRDLTAAELTALVAAVLLVLGVAEYDLSRVPGWPSFGGRRRAG